jgi:hypothetical protein
MIASTMGITVRNKMQSRGITIPTITIDPKVQIGIDLVAGIINGITGTDLRAAIKTC